MTPVRSMRVHNHTEFTAVQASGNSRLATRVPTQLVYRWVVAALSVLPRWLLSNW